MKNKVDKNKSRKLIFRFSYLLLFFIFLFNSFSFISALEVGTQGQIGLDLSPEAKETTNYSTVNTNSSEYWITNEGTLDNVADISGSWINNNLNWINLTQVDNNYVPYTGADKNVILGDYNFSANKAYLNNTEIGKDGTIFWPNSPEEVITVDYDGTHPMWLWSQYNADTGFKVYPEDGNVKFGFSLMGDTRHWFDVVNGDAYHEGDLNVGGDLYSSLTQGSIPFIGADGLLTEDDDLFWDNDNKELKFHNIKLEYDYILGVYDTLFFRSNNDNTQAYIGSSPTGSNSESGFFIMNSEDRDNFGAMIMNISGTSATIFPFEAGTGSAPTKLYLGYGALGGNWKSWETIQPSLNDVTDFGTDTERWKNIYSVDGDFSGDVEIGGDESISGNLELTGSDSKLWVGDGTSFDSDIEANFNRNERVIIQAENTNSGTDAVAGFNGVGETSNMFFGAVSDAWDGQNILGYDTSFAQGGALLSSVGGNGLFFATAGDSVIDFRTNIDTGGESLMSIDSDNINVTNNLNVGSNVTADNGIFNNKVGIGTDNSNYKLSINSTDEDHLKFDDGTYNATLKMVSSGAKPGGLRLDTSYGNNLRGLGINMDPTYALDVAGTLRADTYRAGQISSYSTFKDGKLMLKQNSFPKITRQQDDSNPILRVQQNEENGTGDLLQLYFTDEEKLSVDKDGNVTANKFNKGITGNYTTGNCWQYFNGGVMEQTNCTSI
ncbi:MAG: hypothetical protein ACOC3V_01320 [bacterium]